MALCPSLPVGAYRPSLAVGTADLFFKKATLNSWLKLTDLLTGGNLNKRSVAFLGRYTRFFQNVDILVKK